MATATLISRRKNAYHGPDSGLVRDQLWVIQQTKAKYGVQYLAQNLIWILKKKPEPDALSTLPKEMMNRRLVPFVFNRIQRDLYKNCALRNIYLKFRQGGSTTWFLLVRLFIPAITEPGTSCLIISQNNKYVTKHFKIMQRAYRYIACVDPQDNTQNLLHRQLIQNLFHTIITNRRELVFDQLESSIDCESAEVEEAAQGVSLQHLVCSETSRWEGPNPEEVLANAKEAVVDDGTIDIECTPNGLGGYFYEEVMRASGRTGEKTPEFKYHFHQWFWQDEYKDKEPLEIEEMTDEEKQKKEQFKLDLYQMMWRRKKVISLRHNFPEKYPEDDLTCFLVSGKHFFDRDVLGKRYQELLDYNPAYVGRDGEIRIFKKPKKGKRYIIGADSAEGREVSTDTTDYSAAKVIELETGEECAAYISKLPPEDFADDLAELGRMYNNAMIAVERNSSGGTVILALKIQNGYGNIYQHKEWWKRQREKVIEVEGWPTTPKTRPIMLNALGNMLRNNPELIWDKQLVEEALRFVRDEKGKPAAATGTHDDMVMASAISATVRNVQMGYIDVLHWARQRYGDFEDGDESEAV